VTSTTDASGEFPTGPLTLELRDPELRSTDTTGEPAGATPRRPLLDLSLAELTELLAGWGEPAYRAKQIARWALPEGATGFEAMTNLPRPLRERLAAAFSLAPPPLIACTETDDGATGKLLFDLGDGAAVEAVRMAYDPEATGRTGSGRTTVCVSTQVGCAMGCIFCATGLQGFTRNLGAAEILAQVLHVQRELREQDEQRVSNVVFMGMGEPLANYGQMMRAIRWLVAPEGLGLSARGITISTVGLRSPLARLAEEGLPLSLAISLHAPDDELRRRLVPTAGGTTIDELLAAARRYRDRTGRRVSFAYALIDGVNDAPEQARQLAVRLRRERGHVNLIPYNPVGVSGLRRPRRARVRAFQRELQAAGIATTVRVERGAEIAAACGQLRTDASPQRADARTSGVGSRGGASRAAPATR
jgi:23S rRNA (adenine2503-C2)-methyltransferase